MKAHVCPKCDGRKWVPASEVDRQADPSHRANACPTCEGTGIVWEKQIEDAIRESGIKQGIDLGGVNTGSGSSPQLKTGETS